MSFISRAGGFGKHSLLLFITHHIISVVYIRIWMCFIVDKIYLWEVDMPCLWLSMRSLWKCIIIVFITHLFFKDVQMISFKHHKAVSPYFPEYSFAAKPADPAYFVWLGWGLVGILKTLSVSTVTRLVCRLSYIIVFKFKQISVTRTMLSHHYVYSISVTTYIITISKLSNSDYIFFLLVLMCLFEVLKQFSYKFC